MTETLGDLLRRSADSVPDLRVDVAALVADADRRQRRRRLAVVAATTAVVAVVAAGAWVVRGGQPQEVEPAPSPAPSPPGSVAVDPTGTRPLVYAEGSTVHVGEHTFDAGGVVTFLDATDDGVVFMTGCPWPHPGCAEDTDGDWTSAPLWFNDGSTTEAIGLAPTEHIGTFEVTTAEAGSLVVWADATSRTNDYVGQFVVYDTARHQQVARLPYTGAFNTVLYVDPGHVFYNPDSSSPGCWVYDVQTCDDPHLLRYDLNSGSTRTITQRSFEAHLRGRARLLMLSENAGDTGTTFTSRGMARFNQRGRKLVPVDSNGDPTVVRLTTGEPVELRVPVGYAAPGDETPVVQWLDDDRIVLFANDGGGDLPDQVGDLLECRLPDGVCHVAVPSSSTTYRAPG